MMPRYNFENIKTGEESIIEVSIAELDEFKKNNPDLKQMVSSPAISYRGKGPKIDAGFRDILNKMKKDYPNNKINVPGIKVK